MNRIKNLFYYIFVNVVFLALMYVIVRRGEQLELFRNVKHVIQSGSSLIESAKTTLYHNVGQSLTLLILQIFTILVVARIFIWICSKIGQPTVIGEIIAGIVLGPSVLGLLFPSTESFLFPAASLVNLHFLSQFGLVLFMFIIGMEIDIKVLKTKAYDALIISHAGIIIPFALGMVLAFQLYLGYAPGKVDFLSFSLFMGIAMSLTAFPVLARIVQERGLTQTKLGTLVISCAAADDVTAWCLLAGVIALVKAGTFYDAVFTIGSSIIYVLAMFYMVRPLIKRIGDIYLKRQTLSKPLLASIFIMMLGSAYITEMIGIHALFGAFVAGIIIPANLHFRKLLVDKIEDVSLLLLLPLFFVYTGLRTQVGLMNSWNLWFVFSGILFVAITGKFVGGALTARFTGQSWRDSLSIGALMNTRGLIELIVLNIGYDLGVITPEIFTMMVLMALLTTFMTGPSLDIIDRLFPVKVGLDQAALSQRRVYRSLVSFANPESGRQLLRLAHLLTFQKERKSTITAFHLFPQDEIGSADILEDLEKASFEPIKNEAEQLEITIETRSKVVLDLNKELVTYTNKGHFDFLLVGAGRSVLRGSVLGNFLEATSTIFNPSKLFDTSSKSKKIHIEDLILDGRERVFLDHAKGSVGVYIDRGYTTAKKVLFVFLERDDEFLIFFSERLLENNNSDIRLLGSHSFFDDNEALKQRIETLKNSYPDKIEILVNNIEKEIAKNYDLIITSYSSWINIACEYHKYLKTIPSVLIIRN